LGPIDRDNIKPRTADTDDGHNPEVFNDTSDTIVGNLQNRDPACRDVILVRRHMMSNTKQVITAASRHSVKRL
jgi:hypothetical protein